MSNVLPESVGDNRIESIKSQMDALEEAMNAEWERLIAETEGSVKANALSLHCRALVREYNELVTVLLLQYEAVISNLKEDKEVLDSAMITGQKIRVQEEMKAFEGVVGLGLRNNAEAVLDGQVFLNVMTQFKERCPLLEDILSTLLVTGTARRSILKTPEYRMKCGVNALACLLSVRTQYPNNDVNLVFGLMCITYGAGKQFINMLHAMGLTPCWDSL